MISKRLPGGVRLPAPKPRPRGKLLPVDPKTGKPVEKSMTSVVRAAAGTAKAGRLQRRAALAEAGYRRGLGGLQDALDAGRRGTGDFYLAGRRSAHQGNAAGAKIRRDAALGKAIEKAHAQLDAFAKADTNQLVTAGVLGGAGYGAYRIGGARERKLIADGIRPVPQSRPKPLPTRSPVADPGVHVARTPTVVPPRAGKRRAAPSGVNYARHAKPGRLVRAVGAIR